MHKTILRLAGAAFFLGAVGPLAAGCGSDDPEKVAGPPAAKYPDWQSFCLAAAKAVCGEEEASKNTKLIDGCLIADLGTCHAAVSGNCGQGKLPFSERRLLTVVPRYQAGKAEACVAKVKEGFADGIVDQTEYGTMRETCGVVFSDLVTEGGTCNTDVDCDNTPRQDGKKLTCLLADAAKTMRCQFPVEVGGGQSCADPASDCGEQFCPRTESKPFCRQKNAVGDECEPVLSPCDAGSLCMQQPQAMPTDPVTFACAAKSGTGAACTTGEECTSGMCFTTRSQGLVCKPSLNFTADTPDCDLLKTL